MELVNAIINAYKKSIDHLILDFDVLIHDGLNIVSMILIHTKTIGMVRSDAFIEFIYYILN
jgi:hypothetical protein